ncbi:hypothetical protein Q0Y04_04790 [Clostridioides difficile]|nr:hypothetical protein Q0Y04_04790 [Clostridioides difficile]
MIKLFNGKNYMELARMFEMSVINVRHIVRKNRYFWRIQV